MDQDFLRTMEAFCRLVSPDWLSSPSISIVYHTQDIACQWMYIDDTQAGIRHSGFDCVDSYDSLWARFVVNPYVRRVSERPIALGVA